MDVCRVYRIGILYLILAYMYSIGMLDLKIHAVTKSKPLRGFDKALTCCMKAVQQPNLGSVAEQLNIHTL